MEENKSKPFVCLDVDEKNTLLSVTKRIEELFPDTIVRLKINGNYSSFFYLGKNKWMYKPKVKKPTAKFRLKIYVKDSACDFFEKDQIVMLQHLGIDVDKLKLAGDIYLIDKDLPGMFFTDNENIIIDQTLIQDAKSLSSFLVEQLDCKIVLDLFNDSKNGMMVLKTNQELFGI